MVEEEEDAVGDCGGELVPLLDPGWRRKLRAPLRLELKPPSAPP